MLLPVGKCKSERNESKKVKLRERKIGIVDSLYRCWVSIFCGDFSCEFLNTGSRDILPVPPEYQLNITVKQEECSYCMGKSLNRE